MTNEIFTGQHSWSVAMDSTKIWKGIMNPNLAIVRITQQLRIKLLNYSSAVTIDPTSHLSLQATVGRENGTISIGKETKIHPNAKILPYYGSISIGDNSTVNPFTILYGHGGLEIGDGVRMAAHCTVIPANHEFSDINNPIYKQGESAKGITIEDDVWLGTGCRILDGVVVGEGSVIGAGSVVTKSIPPYSVAVGVPAEVKSKRT